MTDTWGWFAALMILFTPVWVVLVYVLVLEPLLRRALPPGRARYWLGER